MPQIEVFHGASVDNQAEIHVLRHIRQWLEQTGQAAIIFANVKLARQLDLVVFTERVAIVVEVKAWLGRVDGVKNGYWVRTMPDGEPEYLDNGFDQVLSGNQALRDAFREISLPAKSYPYGIVVFRNGLDAGSTVEACGDYRVRICRMDQLETALCNARGQAWAFDDVRALAASLRLFRENDPRPLVPQSRRAAPTAGAAAAGAAVRATPRAVAREVSRSAAEEPSARTKRARKTPILVTLGIVGVLAAVGMGISHKSNRPPGTADASSVHATITPEPTGASAQTADEQNRHHRRTVRHHRSRRADTLAEQASPVDAPAPWPAAPTQAENSTNAIPPPTACPPGVDRLGCPHVVVDPRRAAP